jgi:hypothetical protein
VAYPVNLTTLIERIRQRTNLEGAQAFVTDVEITDLVNSALATWYDEVRGSTWGGQYYRSKYRFDTENSQQFYKLPDDFLALTSLDIELANGMPVVSARAYQEEERNRFRQFPLLYGWTVSSPIWYQLQGDQLSFIPLPSGVFHCQLNYVPTAPKLFAPEDSVNVINGWEEFIVLHAAIRVLTKDGQLDVIPVLSGQLEQERERIRAMAPRRDMQSAERVHMIENPGFDDDYFF